MMINTQTAEPQVYGGNNLDVNAIFSTIQGEGPFSGHPATFIRLAGCNIKCTWCDTEYTERKTMSVTEIYKEVHDIGHNLVVITGGEPMRQEIAPLINTLEQNGHMVQIETNGILWSPGVEETGCIFVCSPKTSKVHPNIYILKKTTNRVYIKLVVGKNAYPTQPELKGGDVLPFHDADFIIPLDTRDTELNKLNYNLAVEYVKIHSNTVVQIQLHKQLGIQ